MQVLTTCFCIRLREDIVKEVGFVETHLSHYTGNQWREFFCMLPATAESLLQEIAPFLAEAENREIPIEKYLRSLFCVVWLCS